MSLRGTRKRKRTRRRLKKRPDVVQLSEADREFLLFRLALGSSVDPDRGCQVWNGGTNSQGYGTISVKGHNLYVHRVIYALTKGTIPAGQFVCHTCDNRICLNESHLVVGDAKDNYEDMRAKGNAFAFGHRVLPRELTFI